MTYHNLDDHILAAHACGNDQALITLYTQAADVQGPVQAPFFLTQAYVFALAAGDPRAGALKHRLQSLGAEE
jgi:hypothetical protein